MIRSKALWYLLLWGLFIGVCAYLIPCFSNDYRYMLIEGSDERVASFSDIALSQWRHYFDWSGRAVAHVIAQTLLYLGRPASACLTALCYVTLILFICFHALGIAPTLKKLRLMPLIIITMGLWLCLRIYGEVVFMTVSAANYLYTTTLVLIFLLPFRLSFKDEKLPDGGGLALLMFLLGILAGWTNENTGAAVGLMTGLFCLWLFLKKRLTLWQATGFIGFCAGYLLLILSPGNRGRLEFMEASGTFTLLGHIPTAFKIFCQTLGTQAPLWMLLLYFCHLLRRGHYQYDDLWQWRAVKWFAAIAFVSQLVMIFSPNYPSRSATPFTVFILCALTAAYAALKRKGLRIWPRGLSVCLGLVLAVYTAAAMAFTVYAYHTAQKDSRLRQAEIISELEQGRLDLEVHPFTVRTSKYVFIGDVRAQEDYLEFPPNLWYHIHCSGTGRP